MSDPTLTYGTVERWIELSMLAEKLLAEWKEGVRSVEVGGLTYGIESVEGKTAFFREVAKAALNMGMSLRVGNRIKGFRGMMRALDPEDVLHLYGASYRIDREEWLTPAPKRS